MDGITWAGSAMVAARTRLEIATQNLANVSTDGFARIGARGFLTPVGVAVDRRPVPGHGALRRTGRDFDLAIVGPGGFSVRDAAGAVGTTRAGAFTREADGTLRDAAGRTLLANGHALRVPDGARIDERGDVIAADTDATVDRLPLPPGSSVHAGFLEGASVDAIHEMVDVLCAERSFESAQKIVSAIDRTREKSSSDVARVK
ncbi:MAG: flagellar basal body rod C-terminal domain-containing protein [Candidatus Tumulicola sp.]